MRISRLNLIAGALLALAASGCSMIPGNYVPSVIKPYRFDIQQGNFVTSQDVAKLKIGMSKEQVRFILGTPLLNDAFHTDRWDYVYRLTRANGQVVQSKYTVMFENGTLTRHGGENLPSSPTGEPVLDKPVSNAPQRSLDSNPSSSAATPDMAEPAIGGTEQAPILK